MAGGLERHDTHCNLLTRVAGSSDFIRRVADSGVIVAIGILRLPVEIREAIEAGATSLLTLVMVRRDAAEAQELYLGRTCADEWTHQLFRLISSAWRGDESLSEDEAGKVNSCERCNEPDWNAPGD